MPPRNMQPDLNLFARMRQGDEEAFVVARPRLAPGIAREGRRPVA